MPSLVYGSAAYDRAWGELPPLTLLNMFVEQAATSEQNACLQSRPGLANAQTDGTGPIVAAFCENGVFGGDLFTISGKTLYRQNVAIGAMADVGDGAYSIAGNSGEVLIAGGGDMYRYTAGGGLAKVTFPDNAHVRAVCFIGSVFVAVRGTESTGAADLYPGRFYWSGVLDGSAWDALDYATAERRADGLLDIGALNDKLILYGQNSIEIWADTGDADLRFARNEGLGSQSKGIVQTGAQCEADNTKFHVGSDGVIYRLGDAFDRISDHWLEAKVAASTSVRLFAFRWQGHEFVCLRLDGETFAYDCATQAWCEFQTDGGQWMAQCAAMIGQAPRFGSDRDGQVLEFSGWADLGYELTREFTAALQLDQPLSIDNLWFWVDSGASQVLSGQGSAPVMEIALSRDAGRTFSDFDDANIGNAAVGGTGSYRVIPEFRRLGQFDAPGMMVQGRVTDPVPFRLSAVKANEPIGGRSRA